MNSTEPQTNTKTEPNAPDFPLEQLYFYLTEGCNLACRHCWLSPKLQTNNKTFPTLPVAIFQDIINQAIPLGLKSVKLTGGEPFMHPQISQILELLKQYNLGLGIESNGVLCTPQLAEQVSFFKAFHISISMDGADAQSHEAVRGIKGCFNHTINGIKNLVNVGIKPQIIFSLMRSNQSELEPLIQLAESLNASSVKINVVQPTGRGETMTTKGETLKVEELLEIHEWINKAIIPNKKINIYFDIPSAFRPLSKMYGPKGDGCASCGILHILGVLADGSYALCGIGNHIKELVFGFAEKDQLADIWLHHPTLLKLRQGIPSEFQGICGRCHMKRVCRASCIAQNYYRSHNLWEPFWFCAEALEKGLFPITRQIQSKN